MPPTRTHASQRAWGWVAALLDGSTTTWEHATLTAEPRLPFFPAAQQLEALRRLNAVAQATGRSAPAGTGLALLTDGVTDRNRGDLRLLGESGPSYGPPAVEPSSLPESDLLPVVAGPLARRLAGHRLAPPRRPLPLRRGWHLAGDPWATAYAQLEEVRRGRGRPGRRALVLADDYATLAVHAWADQALSGGVLGLRTWLRTRIREDQLPGRLDLVGHARRMAERVGRRNTIVAVSAAAVPELRPVPMDTVAVDLARWVGRPLGLAVPSEEKRRLLLQVLIPRASRRAAVLALPEPWAGRLSAYAERQRERLRDAGYPVLGSLDALSPTVGRAPFPTDRAVLDRALDLLLDPQMGVSR